jgi:hypothetical protein
MPKKEISLEFGSKNAKERNLLGFFIQKIPKKEISMEFG